MLKLMPISEKENGSEWSDWTRVCCLPGEFLDTLIHRVASQILTLFMPTQETSEDLHKIAHCLRFGQLVWQPENLRESTATLDLNNSTLDLRLSHLEFLQMQVNTTELRVSTEVLLFEMIMGQSPFDKGQGLMETCKRLAQCTVPAVTSTFSTLFERFNFLRCSGAFLLTCLRCISMQGWFVHLC